MFPSPPRRISRYDLREQREHALTGCSLTALLALFNNTKMDAFNTTYLKLKQTYLFVWLPLAHPGRDDSLSSKYDYYTSAIQKVDAFITSLGNTTS